MKHLSLIGIGIGILVLTATFMFFKKNESPTIDLGNPQFAGSSDCTDRLNRWIAVDAESLVLMVNEARSMRFERNSELSVCIYEGALEHAIELGLLDQQLTIIAELSKLKTETGDLSGAERILLRSPELQDNASVTKRIKLVNILLSLSDLAKKSGRSEKQFEYLRLARIEIDQVPETLLFKEDVYQAEIEYFESRHQYFEAAESAYDLLTSREHWNRNMPGGGDAEYVESAKRNFERLIKMTEKSDLHGSDE